MASSSGRDSFEGINDVIGEIYEVALEPDAISRLLELLASFTGNHSAIFCHRNLDGDVTEFTYGIDPDLESLMFHYADRNPMAYRCARTRIGVPIVADRYMQETEVRTSEIFNQVFEPANLDHVFGANVARHSRQVSSVWLARPHARGAHSAEELSVSTTLVQHLCRAMSLRRKFLEGRAREALLHDGFDILSVPVLITSSDGRLIFANLAGEAFLRNSQHLALSRGRLVARRAADRSRLVRLMQGLGRGTGGSLALGLGNGHATWLMAMPLPEARANRLGLPERDPLGLIVLQRRDCQPGATAELLERLLELTPAEAWLAAAISRGETVAESAAARGVSLNTARTHLKSVFSKTGVSRQAELAAMLAGMSLLRDD